MPEPVVHYVVIDPKGEITAHDSPLTTGDAQDIVGGDIDILPEPADIKAILICNEDGKRQGLEANWLATRLIRHAIRTTDFVTGNVIVAGVPDGHGNLTDLLDADETALRDIAKDV